MIHRILSNLRLKHLAAFTITFLFISLRVYAQQAVIAGFVTDSVTNDEVVGARVRLISQSDTTKRLGAISDRDGRFSFQRVSEGTYDLLVTSAGYQRYSRVLSVGKHSTDSLPLTIVLLPIKTVVRDVVVSATRTERSIEDVPVRIETVAQEEIEEKMMERSANVVELLNETVGTRVQNTSAASNSTNIRLQGLDGRYTQVLVDGFPNYSGLSSTFGLTQLLPLNLQRAEIIKGASSALYGPDAIAGIVNFITKNPQEKPEFSAVLNGTNQHGYDGSAYYGELFDEFGVTLLTGFQKQQLFDSDNDNFSEIPANTHFTITPKFTYEIVDGLNGMTTATYVTEDRRGGVMNAPDSAIGKAAPYIETNNTNRFDIATSLTWKQSENNTGTLRAAATRLTRDSYFGAVPFKGTQNIRFADAQYVDKVGPHTLQIGASLQEDAFDDRTPNRALSRSYDYVDVGTWIEDEAAFGSEWSTVASTRIDHHNALGTFVTPRASILFKPEPILSLRLGGGMGFKAPTIFVEDAEAIGFRNTTLFPGIVAERAQSATFDVNCHSPLFGTIAAKFDAALFVTELDHALLANSDSLAAGAIHIQNASGPTTSRGFEFTSDLSLDELRFTASYAYTDVQQTNNNKTYELPLNPRNWLGLTLSYEDEEEGFRTGVEAYYIGEQHVEDDPFRTVTPSYWLMGALIEKAFGPFHLYLNAENLLNIRQSTYEPLFLGNPMLGDYRALPLWAPVEGRTINGGLRVVL